MKRILITGDSITKGKLGCSYIIPLQNQFPQYEIINLGRDGDTLSGIMKRTLNYLDQNKRFDIIIIAAGHNDIILSDFSDKTAVPRSIVKNLARNGSIAAADPVDFISIYRTFVTEIRSRTDCPLILTTLSCLNEDLSVATNKKREVLNWEITRLVEDNHLNLAPIALEFDNVLRANKTRDYFMNNLYESVLFDRRRSRTDQGADRLSHKRELHLTIDGIHLNSAGAEIYRKVLSQIISNRMDSRGSKL